jgi:hypothetical protein
MVSRVASLVELESGHVCVRLDWNGFSEYDSVLFFTIPEAG